MLAYYNKPQLKQQILEQLQESGIKLYPVEYETRFGIPMVLAHIEDAIFERLPNDLAKNWPIRFMSAIQVGADLSTVWKEFAIWLLVDPVDGVIKYTQPGSDAHQAILQVAQLYQHGYTHQQMRDATDDAYAAAYDANVRASADDFAAYAAYAAAHVACAAAYNDRAARFAADFAASAAALDAAAPLDAAAATKHAAYIKMSNKLIELLQKQEVKHASLPQ